MVSFHIARNAVSLDLFFAAVACLCQRVSGVDARARFFSGSSRARGLASGTSRLASQLCSCCNLLVILVCSRCVIILAGALVESFCPRSVCAGALSARGGGFRYKSRRLTRRAPDKWESPRFLSMFLAGAGFRFDSDSHPAHLRVTQTVRRLYI